MPKPIILLMVSSAMAAAIPLQAEACACGCNVFTVGSRWMMPISAGYSVSLQYDYMDQSSAWGNWRTVSPESIPDQEIRTHFYTAGFQFMPDRNWGVMVELPVWDRYVRTTNEEGDPYEVHHTSLGDVRLSGLFTGLSEDMSTGIQLGLKLPTGPYDQPQLDRDMQIGSGTTDFLLGGYQMGQESGWGWYGQALWQHALNTKAGYRPGDSFDIGAGIHYDGFLSLLSVLPTLQVAVSFRAKDAGENSDPENTGYERLFLSPGIDVVVGNLLIRSNVKIPVMTHVNGTQLVAPVLFGVTVGYSH